MLTMLKKGFDIMDSHRHLIPDKLLPLIFSAGIWCAVFLGVMLVISSGEAVAAGDFDRESILERMESIIDQVSSDDFSQSESGPEILSSLMETTKDSMNAGYEEKHNVLLGLGLLHVLLFNGKGPATMYETDYDFSAQAEKLFETVFGESLTHRAASRAETNYIIAVSYDSLRSNCNKPVCEKERYRLYSNAVKHMEIAENENPAVEKYRKALFDLKCITPMSDDTLMEKEHLIDITYGLLDDMAATTGGKRIFKSRKYGFTIGIPQDRWSFVSTGLPSNMVLTIFNKSEDRANAPAHLDVIVISFPPESADYSGFEEWAFSLLEKRIVEDGDYNTSSEDITWKASSARLFKTPLLNEDGQSGERTVIMTLRNKMAYMISMTCWGDSCMEESRHLSEMLDSFEFTE